MMTLSAPSDTGQERQRRTPNSRRHYWLTVFLVALALWIASVVVLAWTGNVTLAPTAVVLGSFLMPVTGVIWKAVTVFLDFCHIYEMLNSYDSCTLIFVLERNRP